MTDTSHKPAPQPVPTRTLKAPPTNVIIGQAPDAPVTKASIKKLARLGSPKAMAKLVELSGHDNPFVAEKASTKVLEWGFGRPEQNIAIKGEIQHGLNAELLALVTKHRPPPRSPTTTACT